MHVDLGWDGRPVTAWIPRRDRGLPFAFLDAAGDGGCVPENASLCPDVVRRPHACQGSSCRLPSRHRRATPARRQMAMHRPMPTPMAPWRSRVGFALLRDVHPNLSFRRVCCVSVECIAVEAKIKSHGHHHQCKKKHGHGHGHGPYQPKKTNARTILVYLELRNQK